MFISAEDINEFLDIYYEYLVPTIAPNGSNQFCFYGLNYYTNNRTEEILNKLKTDKPKYSQKIINWLEEAINIGNGFLILGI